MELKLQRKGGLKPRKELLIVPYGIETILKDIQVEMSDAFNRTLWN